MSRGHLPVLNVLQGAEATELSFNHDGKTAAQRLTLLHAGDKQGKLKGHARTVISHARLLIILVYSNVYVKCLSVRSKDRLFSSNL